MKGLKTVSKESKYGTRLYYNISTNTANTKGDGYYVTTLIRHNEPEEIKAAIERFMNM